MFVQFNCVEEADNFIGRTVYVEGEKARFIEVKINNNELYFTFEFEDGTTEILDSLTVLYTVKIDEHPFGVQI